MDMLAYGLVSMNEVKNESQIPETDALIEGIADIMDKALTPDDADSEAGKVVLQQIIRAARQQFDEQD
jgi:hypothetical protein